MRPTLRRLAGTAPPALAAVFLVLYAYTAFGRVTFPFELEWLEGGLVDHVVRILDGQPLYVAPSIDFIPYIYVPGYMYLAAAAAKVFGASIVTVRAVSIVCSFALLFVIAAFARREHGSWTSGIVAAGVFAAMYEISGAWLDIARIDSLFLLLIMAAVYLLRFGESTTAIVGSGLLLTAALMAKQTALTLAPALLVYAVVRFGRQGLLAWAAFGISAAVTVALFEWASDGWFLYYAFFAPLKQRALAERYMLFWTTDLLSALPIATTVGLVWCLIAPRAASRDEWAFYALAGAAFVGATWAVRVHAGAWTNTLLPAYLFLALAFTRAAGVLDRKAPGAGALLIVTQLALLWYNPQRYIPTAADRAAAEEFQALLRRAPGEVLVLDHGWFPRLAGKRTFAHEMAIRDVLLMEDEWAERLRAEFRSALASERFDLIVQDNPDWFPVPISVYYRKTARVLSSPEALWPPVGNRVRPEYVYLPRRRSVQGF